MAPAASTDRPNGPRDRPRRYVPLLHRVAAINALLLGTVLYRARLVPRWIPVLGLVGAPLQLASVVTQLLRADHQVTWLAAIAVVPIFLWELSLGVRLVGWGFRPAAVAALDERAVPAPVVQPV